MASFDAQPSTIITSQGQVPEGFAESAEVPAGFPNIVDSPLSWAGSPFKEEGEYVLALNVSDIVEAEAALKSFKARGLDSDLITKTDSVLPTLGKKLDAVCSQVHQGPSFGAI